MRKVDNIHITDDGRKIPIQAVSMLEITEIERGLTAEYRARGEPIDPPTYTVEMVGGDTKEYPITEDNLTVENNEEETKRRMAAWALHSQALSRMKSEIGAITLDVIIEDGIAVDQPPPEWIAKKKRRHVILPEDPDELRKLYIMTEFLRSPMDIAGLQMAIIQISTGGIIPQEKVDAAKDTFFRALEETLKDSIPSDVNA